MRSILILYVHKEGIRVGLGYNVRMQNCSPNDYYVWFGVTHFIDSLIQKLSYELIKSAFVGYYCNFYAWHTPSLWYCKWGSRDVYTHFMVIHTNATKTNNVRNERLLQNRNTQLSPNEPKKQKIDFDVRIKLLYKCDRKLVKAVTVENEINW